MAAVRPLPRRRRRAAGRRSSGEADRIITLLTRRHGRVRAVAKGVRRTTLAVRRPAGAVQPRRPAALHRPQPRHRHARPRRIDAVRRRARRRLPALHRGQRHARDRRAAHRRGARAVAAAVPARPRRAAGPGRAASRDPSLVLDAFLLRAMSVAGWAPALTECARCGDAGPAPRLLGAGRRRGLPGLPADRSALAGPADRRAARARCSTGDWDRADASRAPHRREAQRPGRGATCSGTWSAGCARCRWWSAHERLSAPDALRSARCGRRRRTRPAPARRTSRAEQVPAARRDRHGRQRPLGQGSAGCRGPRATRRGEASLFDGVEGAIELGISSCRRTPSPPRTGGAARTRSASSWASTAT